MRAVTACEEPPLRVDRRRPFIPESFTHLHGSAVYTSLSAAQRLRYNQLCGAMSAELFLAFERDALIGCINRLRRDPRVAAEPRLGHGLAAMVADEDEHARMFRALLVDALPELYAGRERIFTRLGPLERCAAAVFARTRTGSMALLWMSLAIEEHSLALSRAMLGDDPGEFGPLDPVFVDVHRRHLADEVGHLPLDEALVRLLWDPQPIRTRRRQARWFARLFVDVATPRRANVRVIDRLIQEFPDLRPRRRELVRAVVDDSRIAAPRTDIASLEHHPRIAAAWRERAEFAPLLRALAARGTDRFNAAGPRIGAMLGLFALACVGYPAIGAVAAHLRVPGAVLTTGLDTALPMVPAMIVPYASLGAFLLLPAWRCDAVEFRQLVRAGLLAMIVAYLCFLILPLAIEPGPLPDGMWRSAFAATWNYGGRLNTCPSLHVAYASLALLCRRWSWPVCAWWAAIVASTVLTRQHVLVDVVGGLALALGCWWAARRQPT